MASSRKSSKSSSAGPRDLAACVAAQAKKFVKPSARLVVGLSGGVDSVVLLDCLRRVARRMRWRVSALHVDHQLSPNARNWSGFCRRVCAAWRIPFKRVRVRVRRGNSIEAAARAARYAALSRQDCDYIVLAHHRDDQVETLLLQLLRGAGVKGLAAMPFLRDERVGRGAEEKITRSGSSSIIPQPSSLRILRPLLDVTRREILEYAERRGLRWVEDESNRDTRLARNFLRHEVFPVIARRFPAYRETLSRASRHLAEAAEMLDELAARDAAAGAGNGTLALNAIRGLPLARARNLLRHYLSGQRVAVPSAQRLDEALRQVIGAGPDARLRIELGDVSLRQYGGMLHVVSLTSRTDANYEQRWKGERRLRLPQLGGVLTMTPAKGGGISLARLRGRPVTIRVRRGGERLQPDRRRPRRTLKNLLQEARIPPWHRERMPLLFCGDDLVWAAGIGVDSAYQAAPDEAALRPNWVCARPLGTDVFN